MTIGASLKHKNTQPLYIFNRENPQNSEPQNGPRSELDYIALVVHALVVLAKRLEVEEPRPPRPQGSLKPRPPLDTSLVTVPWPLAMSLPTWILATPPPTARPRDADAAEDNILATNLGFKTNGLLGLVRKLISSRLNSFHFGSGYGPELTSISTPKNPRGIS